MNMFKTTSAKTADEYIAGLPDDRRKIVEKVHQTILKTIPGKKPRIISGMIGYGQFHYKSKSGREGDWSLVLLANQKNYISLYICAAENGKYLAETNKDRLGKVSVGRSCIRFKRLEDINLDVVKELVKKTEKLGESGNFAL
jgi:hypothetical protein